MSFRPTGWAWLVSALAFCVLPGSSASAEAAGDRPNIILVTVDTVRTDHLSLFGSERRAMPYITTLGQKGVRFSQAQSTSSWTAPAMASLLSSMAPQSHGVEHGHMTNLTDPDITSQEAISSRIQIWPELMQKAGYRTFGVTANLHLDGRFGFGQGFDEYECVGFSDSDAITKAVEGMQDKIKSSRQYFLWIHILDPHSPYRPRQPWLRHYYENYERMPRDFYSVVVPQTFKDEMGVEEGTREFDFVKALYDSELTHTDGIVRKILKSLAVDEDDLIVFASDHGEEFLDHGRFGHGVTLYEEVTRVPVVIQFPRGEYANSEIDAPISIIDLLPTVIDYLGLKPPRALQGASLLPLLRGEESEPRDIYASLSRFPSLRADTIRRGQWKYYRSHAEGAEPMLFDLAADPREQRNLAASEPERAKALGQALDAGLSKIRAARVEPSTEHLSSEELEQLKALGYAQ